MERFNTPVSKTGEPGFESQPGYHMEVSHSGLVQKIANLPAREGPEVRILSLPLKTHLQRFFIIIRMKIKKGKVSRTFL